MRRPVGVKPKGNYHFISSTAWTSDRLAVLNPPARRTLGSHDPASIRTLHEPLIGSVPVGVLSVVRCCQLLVGLPSPQRVALTLPWAQSPGSGFDPSLRMRF